MEQILLAYGLPKEIDTTIMMSYKNTKGMVHSPDGDFFDYVAGVLQGDILAPYLLILCLDYVLRTSIDLIKENCFTLKKTRSRRYPAKTRTDADYTDYLALNVNSPAQAESLLHRLQQDTGSIGLYVNVNKNEYMCFKQKRTIFTLGSGPLKLVHQFTYLDSNMSSTESSKGV